MSREIIQRERQANGLEQTSRSTTVYESKSELRIAVRGGAVSLWIGLAPDGHGISMHGGGMSMTASEAAHVAGLLFAASAEVAA